MFVSDKKEDATKNCVQACDTKVRCAVESGLFNERDSVSEFLTPLDNDKAPTSSNVDMVRSVGCARWVDFDVRIGE